MFPVAVGDDLDNLQAVADDGDDGHDAHGGVVPTEGVQGGADPHAEDGRYDDEEDEDAGEGDEEGADIFGRG